MILAIGEILVDIFPEYSRTGGAPFNFSHHIKHLGPDIRFLTRVGNDPTGSDILEMIDRNGFETDLVQIDQNYPTGKVMVNPDQTGGHDFDILPDAAYDHIVFPEKPSDISGGQPIRLIYFGTLAQRTASGHNRLQAFLNNRDAGTKCFYDINLREGNYNDDIILKSLEHTDILKLNTDELEYIRKMFQINSSGIDSIRWLIEKFDIEVVSLTKGAGGSAIITANEHESRGVPEFEITDTVGAGDAYAAIFAIGCLRGLPFERIISIATKFSANICQIKGAVPENPSFYDHFRKQLSGATDV